MGKISVKIKILSVSAFLLQLLPNTSFAESIKLDGIVCTEGSPAYGLAACSNVKLKSKTNLNAEVSNWISWYYDGKVLVQHDKNDYTYCSTPAKIIVPVCNANQNEGILSKPNWKSESCGKQCVFQFGTHGRGGVDDIYSQQSAQDGNGNWYNWWRHDSSELSALSAEGDSCKLESAWMRGYRVQSMLKNLNAVKKEIAAGELKVTPVNEGGICQGYLNSILRILDGVPSEKKLGLKEVREKFRIKFNYDKKALHTLETEACGDETAATASTATYALKDSILGKQTAAVKDINQGYCHLRNAQSQVEYIFSRVAMCEVLIRSKIEYFTFTQNADDSSPNSMINGSIDKIFEKCRTELESRYDTRSLMTSSGKTNFLNSLNTCYYRESQKFYSTNPGPVTSEEPPAIGLAKFEKFKDKAGTVGAVPACN